MKGKFFLDCLNIYKISSPLVKAGRIVDLQPPQTKTVINPQNVSKSFSECEEVSTPVQTSIQIVRPNNAKGGFGLTNPLSGDQNKNIEVEVQDLENPENISELLPIEAPLKAEDNGEKNDIDY
jgi:hypothetical protein